VARYTRRDALAGLVSAFPVAVLVPLAACRRRRSTAPADLAEVIVVAIHGAPIAEELALLRSIIGDAAADAARRARHDSLFAALRAAGDERAGDAPSREDGAELHVLVTAYVGRSRRTRELAGLTPVAAVACAGLRAASP
jgi:hypothetical protein